MKIAIFTSEEYAFLYGAWQRTIPELQKSHDVVGLWLFPDILKNLRGWHVPVWYVCTFGLLTTVALALRALVTRLAERGNYESLARFHGVSFHRARTPNAPEVVQWVKDQQIDVVLITVGFIIKQPLIDAVRVAVVNKHSALLPSCRGLLPVFWTLLTGETPVGVTVHKIDTEIDHGEIILQRAYPEFRGSVYDAYTMIYRDMPELLTAAIHALETGERALVTAPRHVSYHSLPSRADVRLFRAKGLRFV
ncbi:MAG: formyltransferase family protein [Patescibacteria group bacterium]